MWRRLSSIAILASLRNRMKSLFSFVVCLSIIVSTAHAGIDMDPEKLTGSREPEACQQETGNWIIQAWRRLRLDIFYRKGRQEKYAKRRWL